MINTLTSLTPTLSVTSVVLICIIVPSTTDESFEGSVIVNTGASVSGTARIVTVELSIEFPDTLTAFADIV